MPEDLFAASVLEGEQLERAIAFEWPREIPNDGVILFVVVALLGIDVDEVYARVRRVP